MNRTRYVFLIITTASAAASTHGQVVITHDGMTDPLTEGFAVESAGGFLGEPVLDNDVASWSLQSPGFARYQTGDLPPEQKAAALENGWKIVLVARVADAPNGDGLVTCNLENLGGRRFDMNLGVDNDGNPFVRLNLNILPGPVGVGPTAIVGDSAQDYHTYELIYDPDLLSADLFIDGVEVISDYPGHTNFVRPLGFYMGVYSTHLGHYSFAQFEILQRTELPGDFDNDGDIDLTDFVEFQTCKSGPDTKIGLPDCQIFDLDADNDVDFTDAGVMQLLFTGPTQTLHP